MTNYHQARGVIKYLDFLHSENGQIQQEILTSSILEALSNKPGSIVLDAGCGPGWLVGKLKNKYQVYACDSSELLIKFANTRYKDIDFKVADLKNPLPYQTNFFDNVILNMVGPDLEDLESVFKQASRVLKKEGKLILTIPNPKYSYPAAEWKRSFLDILFFRKPKIFFKTPPAPGTKIEREFTKGNKIASFYYTEENYIQAAKNAGLKLVNKLEIKSKEDSKKFNLRYQLYRYPLILQLEFEFTDTWI